MAFKQSLTFLVLFVSGLASAQMASQCNSAMLDSCLQPFQVWSDGFAYGTVTASNISTACNSYNATVACVLNTANCPDTDPITMAKWLGKKQVVGYCCTTGMNDYLNNQVCLASGTFLNALGGCGLTANTSLSPSDACMALSNRINCINTATQRTCNANTTAFINKISPWLLGPSVRATSPSCTGQCNVTALNACLAAFSNVSLGFALSIYNATTLDTACSAFNTTVNCALNQANCSDNDAITMASGWTGKKYAVNRICYTNRQAFLANQPCQVMPAFGAGIVSCFNPPIASGLDPTAACRQFNQQVTCIGTAANATCGPTVANAMLQGAVGDIGPAFLVNYPNCVVNNPVLFGGAAALWMNLFLLLASIFVTLLV